MADIATVRSPMLLSFNDGNKKLIAAAFPHRLGLMYFDLYWPQLAPADAVHILQGKLTGDGPWKIANAVIRLVGCQNTDPDEQDALAAWEHFINTNSYPPHEQILEIAGKLGASV